MQSATHRWVATHSLGNAALHVAVTRRLLHHFNAAQLRDEVKLSQSPVLLMYHFNTAQLRDEAKLSQSPVLLMYHFNTAQLCHEAKLCSSPALLMY